MSDFYIEHRILSFTPSKGFAAWFVHKESGAAYQVPVVGMALVELFRDTDPDEDTWTELLGVVCRDGMEPCISGASNVLAGNGDAFETLDYIGEQEWEPLTLDWEDRRSNAIAAANLSPELKTQA